jgi:hypothetical protein
MCKLTKGFGSEYTRLVYLKKTAFIERHLAFLRPCGIVESGSRHGLIPQNLSDTDLIGIGSNTKPRSPEP